MSRVTASTESLATLTSIPADEARMKEGEKAGRMTGLFIWVLYGHSKNVKAETQVHKVVQEVQCRGNG